MNAKVYEILEYGSEGYLVDFKQGQYELGNNFKKHEFLKDISALANHPNDGDKFIIIGIIEKNGIADNFTSIPELTDQANYQQFLNEYLEPQINFEYRPISFKDFQLAYFRIFNNMERPYLFKKEFKIIKSENKVEKENNNKIIYREGDGLIRTGSGTRKMVRSDFERIYKNRITKSDRKSDIRISPVLIGLSNHAAANKTSVKILDINIENTSNTSLDFDIELIIYKNECYTIITKTEFERRGNYQSPNRIYTSNAVLSNFHVDNEENEEYFIFRRTKLRNMKTAVSISQNNIEKEIFDKEVIIIFREPISVIVDVTIRSDDFTEGAFSQRFEVKI